MNAFVLSDLTVTALQAEVMRAHLKHSRQGGSLRDPAMSTERKLAALGEEFGEVCRALTYDGDQGQAHLVKELIQVASVALTWVEALEGSQEAWEELIR